MLYRAAWEYAPMGVKRGEDIEKLLQWVYREELPKGYRRRERYSVAPGISPMFRYADLGGPVDDWTQEPGFPVALGTTPHPDALLIDFAVRGLEPVIVDWRRERSYLLGDLALYIGDEDPIAGHMATGPQAALDDSRRGYRKFGHTVVAAARVNRHPIVEPYELSPAAYVMLHARMANRPIWDLGPVTLKRCTPVVVGRQLGKNRYTEGTHCPLQLDPPIHEIACARFEYAIWHQALMRIAESIPALQDHVALAPAAPPRPWITGEEAKPRVVASAHRPDMDMHRRLPLKPARPIALPPIESKIEIEMRSRRARRAEKPKQNADDTTD